MVGIKGLESVSSRNTGMQYYLNFLNNFNDLIKQPKNITNLITLLQLNYRTTKNSSKHSQKYSKKSLIAQNRTFIMHDHLDEVFSTL